MKFKFLEGAIVSLVIFVFTSSASAGLIVNGGFETGNFNGWLVSQAGGSTQAVVSGAGDPNLGPSLTSGFYAFSGNQSGPSQNIVWQSVIVPENLLSATFSFDFTYRNVSSVFASPDTLAFDGVSNQQFRADVTPATKHQSATEQVVQTRTDNRAVTVLQRHVQEVVDTNQKPIQKKDNRTGLPDNLKSGMENLSGMSLDHVKVHHNSAKSAMLQAHAYA